MPIAHKFVVYMYWNLVSFVQMFCVWIYWYLYVYCEKLLFEISMFESQISFIDRKNEFILLLKL